MKTRTFDQWASLFNGICLSSSGMALTVNTLLADSAPFYKAAAIIIFILLTIAGILSINEFRGGEEDGR